MHTLTMESKVRQPSNAFALCCASLIALVSMGACTRAAVPAAAPAPALGAQLQAQTIVDVDALLAAVKELKEAAPAPTGRGWDATQDAAALAKTRDAWKRARAAYERIEGVLAPLFPDIDSALDERFDGAMELLLPKGDTNLFDDQGFVGMHAVERILFAPETRAAVIAHEREAFKNKGYVAAAWPKSQEEAAGFKTLLCAQLIKDVESLRTVWTPQNMDTQGAYDGLEGLVAEQREKVSNAASSEEESRYANVTLADLRSNLEGLERAFSVFKSAIAKRSESKETLLGIEASFARLHALYKQFPGDAVPEAPATFAAEAPSAADLESDFGKLWKGVTTEVDLKNPQGLLVLVQNARVWAVVP